MSNLLFIRQFILGNKKKNCSIMNVISFVDLLMAELILRGNYGEYSCHYFSNIWESSSVKMWPYHDIYITQLDFICWFTNVLWLLYHFNTPVFNQSTNRSKEHFWIKWLCSQLHVALGQKLCLSSMQYVECIYSLLFWILSFDTLQRFGNENLIKGTGEKAWITDFQIEISWWIICLIKLFRL